MQTYIPTDVYHGVLDQLEELFVTFEPSKPDCLRTRLIMILGEEGGIWPSSCRNGTENESLKHAA